MNEIWLTILISIGGGLLGAFIAAVVEMVLLALKDD